MAACTSLSSITKGCDNNIGGIKEVYLFDMSDIFAGPTPSTDWMVTTLTLGSTGGSASMIKGFDLTRNTSNYTEEAGIDLNNGSSFVTQTLNLMFNRREAAKSKSIKILGEGQRYLGAVVKDANDQYWLLQDLQISGVAEGSGTAKADGSKYSVTLKSEVPFLAYGIGATQAASLISTGKI